MEISLPCGEGRVRGVIFGNYLKNIKKIVKIDMLIIKKERNFYEKEIDVTRV